MTFDAAAATASPRPAADTARPAYTTASPVRSPLYSQSVPPQVWRWLAGALDELDYGILVLFEGMRVVHVNEAARVELDDRHPLQLCGETLCARLGRDIAPLHEAVTGAARHGKRRLLTVGLEVDRTSVSVIPLHPADAGPRAVLVVLGKRAVCEPLSVQGFARDHRLTAAETRVLVALCNGTPPLHIAEQLGVAVSTVRSQIGSIRQKTGTRSIRALVRQVAVLPPVKSVLGRYAGDRAGVFGFAPHLALA